MSVKCTFGKNDSMWTFIGEVWKIRKYNGILEVELRPGIRDRLSEGKTNNHCQTHGNSRPP